MGKEEVWKSIKGYEDLYEISNYGRVKSLARLRKSKNGSLYKSKEKILKPQTLTKGYLGVRLYKDNKGETLKIHRLVYETFIGQIPKGYDVNHIDEDKTNNCVWNLNLMTKEENNAYGTRNKRIIEKCGKQVIQYTLEGQFVAEYPSIREAERQTGIKHQNISKCCYGDVKSAGGFIWKLK